MFLDHEDCGVIVVENEFGFPFKKGPGISNQTTLYLSQMRKNSLS